MGLKGEAKKEHNRLYYQQNSERRKLQRRLSRKALSLKPKEHDAVSVVYDE